MLRKRRQSSGVGLERSCGELAADWLRSSGPEYGVELLEAWFRGPAYRQHRHDTYAICLTIRGVQAFECRGSTEIGVPGQVVVLHPDQLHDGYAGTEAGLGYRQLYVDPTLILEAAQVLQDSPCSLPFVRSPVVESEKPSQAILGAFEIAQEPLAIDNLVMQLADGLIELDPSCKVKARHRRTPTGARVSRYRKKPRRPVGRTGSRDGSHSLRSGRQFRLMCGTSPYRYLLMRRLDSAHNQIAQRRPLGDVAFNAGVADQAHFSRAFKAAFGLTPARYRALCNFHSFTRRW